MSSFLADVKTVIVPHTAAEASLKRSYLAHLHFILPFTFTLNNRFIEQLLLLLWIEIFNDFNT